MEAGGRATPGTAEDQRLFPPLMQRISAGNGILFVLLLLISIFAQSEETPDWSDAPAQYALYAAENVDEVQFSSLFLLFAAIALLWFAGYLRTELGRSELVARGYTRLSHTTFAGGIVAAAGLSLMAIVNVVAVSQPAGTDPYLIRGLMHLSFAIFALATVGLITLTAAASILIVRVRSLPVWLGWVGLVDAVLYFLTLFIALAPEDEDFVLGFAFFPAFVLFLIWILASSIVLVRRVGRPPGGPGVEAA